MISLHTGISLIQGYSGVKQLQKNDQRKQIHLSQMIIIFRLSLEIKFGSDSLGGRINKWVPMNSEGGKESGSVLGVCCGLGH